jgi:putative endonuclease
MDPDLGQYGEELAADYLTERGYIIEQTNYRNQYGEIDIIARDGEMLCFVEVKTREDEALGSPFEAITVYKQRQIASMAQIYLNEKRLDGVNARFDVVGIVIRPEDETAGVPKIELIKNAFFDE